MRKVLMVSFGALANFLLPSGAVLNANAVHKYASSR